METGFANGQREPVVEFDYDAIDDALDRGNPLVAEISEATPKRESDAYTLAKVFGMLLTYGGTDSHQFFITANVLAFVVGVHPNQESGGVAIASGLQMEKGTFFRRVNQMRKILKARGSILPRIAGEWTNEARQTIKTTTTQSHEKRKLQETHQPDVAPFEKISRTIAAAGIAN